MTTFQEIVWKRTHPFLPPPPHVVSPPPTAPAPRPPSTSGGGSSTSRSTGPPAPLGYTGSTEKPYEGKPMVDNTVSSVWSKYLPLKGETQQQYNLRVYGPEKQVKPVGPPGITVSQDTTTGEVITRVVPSRDTGVKADWVKQGAVPDVERQNKIDEYSTEVRNASPGTTFTLVNDPTKKVYSKDEMINFYNQERQRSVITTYQLQGSIIPGLEERGVTPLRKEVPWYEGLLIGLRATIKGQGQRIASLMPDPFGGALTPDASGIAPIDRYMPNVIVLNRNDPNFQRQYEGAMLMGAVPFSEYQGVKLSDIVKTELSVPMMFMGGGATTTAIRGTQAIPYVGQLVKAGVIGTGGFFGVESIRDIASTSTNQMLTTFKVFSLLSQLGAGAVGGGVRFSDLSFTKVKEVVGGVRDVFKGGYPEQPLIGERVVGTKLPEYIAQATDRLDIYEFQKGGGVTGGPKAGVVTRITEGPRTGRFEMYEVTRPQAEVPLGPNRTVTRFGTLDIIEATPSTGISFTSSAKGSLGLVEITPGRFVNVEGFMASPRTTPVSDYGLGSNIPSRYEAMPQVKDVAQLRTYDIGTIRKGYPSGGWSDYFMDKPYQDLLFPEPITRTERTTTGLFETVKRTGELRGGVVRGETVKTLIGEEGFYKSGRSVLDTFISSKDVGSLSVTEGVGGKPFKKVGVFDVIREDVPKDLRWFYDESKSGTTTILGELKNKDVRLATDEFTRMLDETGLVKRTKVVKGSGTPLRFETIETGKGVVETGKPVVVETGKGILSIGETIKSKNVFKESETFVSPELNFVPELTRGDVRLLDFIAQAERDTGFSSGKWQSVRPSGPIGVTRPGAVVTLQPGGVISISGPITKTAQGQIDMTKIMSGEINISQVIQNNINKQSNDLLLNIDRDVVSITKSDTMSNQLTDQARKNISATKQGSLSLLNLMTTMDLITIQETNKIVTTSEFNFYRDITTTDKIIKPVRPTKPSEEEKGFIGGFGSKEPVIKNSFYVEVRGRQYAHGERIAPGTFHKALNKPLTFNDAMSLGVHITGTSEKATFKLTPSNEKPRSLGRKLPSWEDKIYQYDSKNNNIWVERSAFRIDSPGEIRSITMKGIEANRGKRK